MTARQQTGRCPSGKVRYRNRNAVIAAVQRTQQYQRRHGDLVDSPRGYYRCTSCNGWHLTHYPVDEQVRRRRRDQAG